MLEIKSRHIDHLLMYSSKSDLINTEWGTEKQVPAIVLQHRLPRWWISVAVLPNWAAGAPKSFSCKQKKNPTVDWQERVMICSSRPFPWVKTTLCLFITLNQIMFVLLSTFLSVILFYSHKLINIFADFLPASAHEFSYFLLPPLFICHTFSLQSRMHLSKINMAFSPSFPMLTVFLFYYFWPFI